MRVVTSAPWFRRSATEREPNIEPRWAEGWTCEGSGEYVGSIHSIVQNRPLVTEKERINLD